ncbi:hypothetical protein N7486_001524 [Penicillium sp. IBT 16267x]|nr:hypothetical protein N7486_001524 [Penicillium sp. IBT 16267x]
MRGCLLASSAHLPPSHGRGSLPSPPSFAGEEVPVITDDDNDLFVPESLPDPGLPTVVTSNVSATITQGVDEHEGLYDPAGSIAPQYYCPIWFSSI